MNDDRNWRKATYSGSGGGSCMEVGETPGVVLVRDTKQGHLGDSERTMLRLAAGDWRRFISIVRRNHL